MQAALRPAKELAHARKLQHLHLPALLADNMQMSVGQLAEAAWSGSAVYMAVVPCVLWAKILRPWEACEARALRGAEEMWRVRARSGRGSWRPRQRTRSACSAAVALSSLRAGQTSWCPPGST